MTRLARTRSLPALDHRRSPLAQPQLLCTVDVQSRSVVREAVAGRDLKVLSSGRMPFVAFERGVQYDRGPMRAELPKERPPPLREILSAIRAMDLESDFAEQRPPKKLRRRSAAFGGCPRVQPGPRLPIRAPRVSLDDVKPRSRESLRRSRTGTAASSKPSRQTDLDGRPASSLDRPMTVDVAAESAALGVHLASASRDDQQAPTDQLQHAGEQQPRGAVGKKADMELQPPSTATEAANSTSAQQAEALQALPVLVDCETVEVPDPWDDAKLHAVFHRWDTDSDGEVHKDDLPAILQYLGARHAPDDAMRIVAKQTPYATLSFEEFCEFMTSFREFDLKKLRVEFKAADTDHSGGLSFEEIHALLHEMGYAPTRESSREAMAAIDMNNDGVVDFLEFDRLLEHLRKTEGLTLREIGTLQGLYDRSMQAQSQDESEREDVCDVIWRITVILGYPASKQCIEQIVHKVDPEHSSTIAFQDLLKIVRQVRDAEKDQLVKVLRQRQPGVKVENFALPIDELGIACQEMGYFVSEDAILEIVDSLGDLKDEDSLTLEEMINFIIKYRWTEGFTKAEVAELTAAFEREAKGSRQALRTLDVSRVLRWFGYSRTVQETQQLVASIDFDHSGELELDEFLKLMRRLQQDACRCRHEAFSMLSNVNTHEIPVVHLGRALVITTGTESNHAFVQTALEKVAAEIREKKAQEAASGGKSPAKGSGEESPESPATPKSPKPPEPASPSQSPKLPKGRGWGIVKSQMPSAQEPPKLEFLNEHWFEVFVRYYRKLVVEETKANAGYSSAEVSKLRSAFQSYDKDKGGVLERQELVKLLSEYFPDSTKSKEGQRELQLALEEVDKDGNGELDFNEFLFLMRLCDDQRDRNDLKLELDIVTELGMGGEEVEGYRQIFAQNIDWKGELSLDRIMSLLAQVLELKPDEFVTFAQMVRDVHPQGREVARFPQFLQLVKRLTEDNYARVNDHAARMVKAEHIRRQRQSFITA